MDIVGPNGEKRPADPIAAAHQVASIAVGDADEDYVKQAQRDGGRKGGIARASSLSAERRSEIARRAARARWG